MGHHVLATYYAPQLASVGIRTRDVADQTSDLYYPAWKELAHYKEVDWDALAYNCHTALRLQDNIIDYTDYFLDENRETQLSERRVGIGSMGLGTLMIQLKLRYGSKDGNKFVSVLYKFIAYHTYKASMLTAKEKGAFPKYEYEKFIQSGFMKRLLKAFPDLHELLKRTGIRNVTSLTQAPTGSTGTEVDNIPLFREEFGGNSTGIEPYYAWSYWRAGRLGAVEQTVHLAEKWLLENGFDSKDFDELPDFFANAMDLTPLEHVMVQAAVQEWTDSSISKTANCPADFSIEDTDELYMEAYKLGLKGMTIYRDNSRDAQVLSTTKEGAKIEAHIEAEQIRKLQEEENLEFPKGSTHYSTGEAVDATKVAFDFDKSEGEEKVTVTKRPSRLFGFTEKVLVPFGDKMVKAYININVDGEGKPFEVFISSNTPEFEQLASVVGRMVTTAIRRGDSLEHIVKDLRKGQTLGTLPARLATLLEHTFYGKIEFPFAAKKKVVKATFAFAKCADCGEMAFDKPNCICTKCGSSKCN